MSSVIKSGPAKGVTKEVICISEPEIDNQSIKKELKALREEIEKLKQSQIESIFNFEMQPYENSSVTIEAKSHFYVLQVNDEHGGLMHYIRTYDSNKKAMKLIIQNQTSFQRNLTIIV